MGMKKDKIHSVIEKGYVYIGGNLYKKRNGRIKNGTAENDLDHRINKLKRDEHFTLFGYIEFYNTTKTRLEIIEAHMKDQLENYFQHVGNDHFIVPINKYSTKDTYVIACAMGLLYGISEAERRGYEYTVHWVR